MTPVLGQGVPARGRWGVASLPGQARSPHYRSGAGQGLAAGFLPRLCPQRHCLLRPPAARPQSEGRTWAGGGTAPRACSARTLTWKTSARMRPFWEHSLWNQVPRHMRGEDVCPRGRPCGPCPPEPWGRGLRV